MTTEEPVFERLWHEATSHLHHHGHQAANTNQGETVNLTEIHEGIANFVNGVEGWAEDMKGKLPDIAAKAQQFASSPIFQALDEIGAVVLPPGTEQAIAGLIRAAAKDIGAVPPPASPAPGDGDSGTTAAGDGQPAETVPAQ